MNASSPIDSPSAEHPVLVPDWPAPLTRQDVFSRVWEWAKTHDRCLRSQWSCLYRSDDNTNACLIGACLPDSAYAKALRPAGSIGSIVARSPIIRAVFAEEVTGQWLRDLQEVHNLFSPGRDPDKYKEKNDYWGHSLTEADYRAHIHQRLRAFALKHNLTVPSE